MVRSHGRVVVLKVETDGDIHIALRDAIGDKPGVVVAEIPAKAEWCEIRKVVLACTRAKFPFHIRSTEKSSARLACRRQP